MIYVVRHGETEWNALNKVLGRTDVPLNERGLEQAKKVAEYLQKMALSGTVFVRILASPLKRTHETAHIISETIGVPVTAEKALIEMNFGIWEGEDRRSAAYQAAKRDFFSRYPGGESFLDVAARVYPLLHALAKEPGNTVLVTHNGICRIIASFFKNLGNEEAINFAQGNCEVKKYDFASIPEASS